MNYEDALRHAGLTPDVRLHKLYLQGVAAGMAENARELGLLPRSGGDYEPVMKDNSNYRYDPPIAEPVIFYRCNGCGHAYEQVHPTSCDCMEAGGFDRVEYYTTPPAQPAPYVASQLVQQSRSDVEPVAWMWEQRAARSSSGIGGWDKLILFCKPVDDPFVEKRNLAPLYTTPPAQPLLKPLTKDQITKFYGGDSPLVFQIIREVEAHHGIKEKNT